MIEGQGVAKSVKLGKLKGRLIIERKNMIKIQEFLNRHGLSPRELGALIGSVPTRTVQDWASGRSRPDTLVLLKAIETEGASLPALPRLRSG